MRTITVSSLEEIQQRLGKGHAGLDVGQVRGVELHQLRPLDPLLHQAAVLDGGHRITAAAEDQGRRTDRAQLLAEIGIAHRRLKPTIGILDPENTRTLPPEVAASTGLDVLSHAIESYTAIPYASRPRPERPVFVNQFRTQVPHYMLRHKVRAGITGWAQVNGRAALPWDERIELDLWYVDHRSLSLDLRILARTPFALFGNTYKGETGGWKS